MGERFFVGQTLPASEHVAAVHLRLQRFEAWYPTKPVDPRSSRRLKKLFGLKTIADVPIISGYIFIKFDRELRPWRSINGTRGMRGILGAPEWPTPVPVGVVEEMMERWAAGDYALVDAPVPFRYGDRLRITAGAFADRVATFDAADGDELQVVLDLFGRELKIPLMRDAVVAA